jgi:cysteine synthase A
MCHWLARRHGLLLGGSSGSVLAAIAADSGQFDPGSTVVAISPDLGDKYMDTIYSPDWVAAHFGNGAAAQDTSAPAPLNEPLSEVIARHSRAFDALLDRYRRPDSYERHPSWP